MKEKFIVKATKKSLIIVINEKEKFSFEELKKAIGEKFKSSANFFGEDTKAIEFTGKELSDDEKIELLEVIKDNCRLDIPCVFDENEELDEKLSEIFMELKIKNCFEHAKLHMGSLRSGQVVKSKASVVIVGDLNEGSEVIADGNVIVFGGLYGNVTAGADGNTDTFVAAMDMSPVQICIGDTIACAPDTRKRKFFRNKEKIAKVAYWDNGNIFMEELNRDTIKILKI